MCKNDKATVIIPCYNVGDYIIGCLDSVRGQLCVDHTYVVDNNSKDDTIAKVQAWQNEYPDFPLTIILETKQGAPAARNAPLPLVETKWIQYLDADDLIQPNKIAEQIKLYPDADVVYAGATYRNLNTTEVNTTPEKNIPLALMQGKAGNTCSNLFSTSSLRSVGGWDETLQSSQEYDLMFRLWKAGASFFIDFYSRAIIRQRAHGQISTSNRLENLTRYIQLREQMLKEFQTRDVISDRELKLCRQHVFDNLRLLAKFNLSRAVDSRHLFSNISACANAMVLEVCLDLPNTWIQISRAHEAGRSVLFAKMFPSQNQ